MNLFLGTTSETLLDMSYGGPIILSAFLRSLIKLAESAEGFMGLSVSMLQQMTSTDAGYLSDIISVSYQVL